MLPCEEWILNPWARWKLRLKNKAFLHLGCLVEAEITPKAEANEPCPYWSIVMAHSKCGAFTVGKGWRRTIGRKIGDGGKLMPCRFWLGTDKPKATATALQIESLWVGLDAPYWNVEAFKAAEAIRIGAMVKDAPQSLPSPPLPLPTQRATAVLTVMGLIDRFRKAYLTDARRSEPSKNSMVGRLKTLERSPIVGLPLERVGAEQLAAVVGYWLARPPCGKAKRAISEFSARMIVKTARAVFDWADAMGLWQAPRRFDRLFRLPKVKTAPMAIKTFSVDELARLFKRAKGQMPLLILLALNCGFCSAELATLRKDECDLKSATVKRARQKTAVVQQWKLWPETVKALKANMACNGDLALLHDGLPIVRFNANHRRLDPIPKLWAEVMEQANGDGGLPIEGSFKTLRKTGATMMRAIGGIEVSELYLAHSEKSMARFYSTPSVDALTDALTNMRKHLAPLFAK
jgi:integrase